MRIGSPWLGSNPFDWRQETAEGRTWRLATLDDVPRLRELWSEMDRALGPQDKPDLFLEPVVLTLVAEDETGKVVAGLYGEAVVDWTMIGTDRKAARSTTALVPELHFFLYERGIRAARVLVPQRMRKHMRKLLPQLNDLTQRFAHFACTIQP